MKMPTITALTCGTAWHASVATEISVDRRLALVTRRDTGAVTESTRGTALTRVLVRTPASSSLTVTVARCEDYRGGREGGEKEGKGVVQGEQVTDRHKNKKREGREKVAQQSIPHEGINLVWFTICVGV